ncbi:unnamed protein product [Caenorhabditis auriculariae]|uniref:Uncharacterized protein n=1 Tax=Caenorhabditis auriculariae TaxID=2777116 RepID=A0A8S1HTW5_9PELO|nr:unnamed protein product [Caenorhabditis auriculariae]
MRKWDALAVAVQHDVDAEEVFKEVEFLEKQKLFEADEIVVANDACEDVGSAGSALNAFLLTTERLCAKRGFTVLSEDVINNSKILIVLVGPRTKDMLRSHGKAFEVETKETPPIETDVGFVPDTPLVSAIRDAGRVAQETSVGVFLIGTENKWNLGDIAPKVPSNTSITAYSFIAGPAIAECHGVYLTDDTMKLKSLEYCCEERATKREQHQIALAFLYLPPSIACAFLSLHSGFPMSSATYYGIDSGAIGLKVLITG